jgi:hypothetical protein
MIDLLKGAEFYDMESKREMLVKLLNGQPWLFYKAERGGDWMPLRVVTEEEMELLEAAYQEALNRPRNLAHAYEPVLPTQKGAA